MYALQPMIHSRVLLTSPQVRMALSGPPRRTRRERKQVYKPSLVLVRGVVPLVAFRESELA